MAASGPPPRPPRRIVLLTGASGTDLATMARRTGLPVLPLDAFSRDHDATGPRRGPDVEDHVQAGSRHGPSIGQRGDAASWDAGAALEALTCLAHDGVAEVPGHAADTTAHRSGSVRLAAGDAPLVLAAGRFAAELIAPLDAADLLADAIALRRPAPVQCGLRLVLDPRERRADPPAPRRRGERPPQGSREPDRRIQVEMRSVGRRAGAHPAGMRSSMRPEGLRSGIGRLRRLRAVAEAEASHRHRAQEPDVLRITAVCFVRRGGDGDEVLAVRKRGTGSYMQVGGKLEPGESAAEAAVREVAEEIGVRLEPSDLELLGQFEAVAANEPNTLVRSTVFTCDVPVPEPLEVLAELEDHRWVSITEPGGSARLAPLMVQHILPALRSRHLLS